MKILNRTGPSIHPWSTLLVTKGLQLHFTPLIATLSSPAVQPVFDPPLWLHIQLVFQQLLCWGVVGDSVKGPAESKQKIQLPVHRAGDFIKEAERVG